MIPDLSLKSLQHFGFIFIYGMKVVQFDSFACSCPVFPTPFIGELSFPPCTFLPPLMAPVALRTKQTIQTPHSCPV